MEMEAKENVLEMREASFMSEGWLEWFNRDKEIEAGEKGYNLYLR
jgi:hypothetical protein